MKKYKIGVVGAGAIAQNCHIPGYAAAENCELVAIADPVRDNIEAVHKAGHVFANQYEDYRDMLAAHKLDAVSICTPNKFHAQIAHDCLMAGCDILLEKPIAMTLEEAALIEDAVRSSGKRVMVAFSHRFNELNHAAKTAIEQGRIGKPYMYRVRMAHSGPFPGWAKTDWFYNPKMAGGGALMDMAVHAFDILRWYEGEIRSVSACVATLRKEIEVDDNVVAWVTFEGACLGYIECGWTSPSGFIGIEIMGDNGSIVVDYGKSVTLMHCGSITPDGSIDIKEHVLAKGYSQEPWPAQMQYFTAGLDSSDPFMPCLRDGIDTLRVVLAAYESSSERCHIAI